MPGTPPFRRPVGARHGTAQQRRAAAELFEPLRVTVEAEGLPAWVVVPRELVEAMVDHLTLEAGNTGGFAQRVATPEAAARLLERLRGALVRPRP